MAAPQRVEDVTDDRCVEFLSDSVVHSYCSLTGVHERALSGDPASRLVGHS